jgi:hypothetical protein
VTERVESFCDDCGKDISEGMIVYTDRIDEELNVPIVELYCYDCWRAGEVRWDSRS